MHSAFHLPSNVEAVVFDVYGTIAYIRDKRMPFRKMARMARERGLVSERFALELMSSRIDLSAAASLLGMTIDHETLNALECDLKAELESVTLFEDSTPALTELRLRGIKVAICSNLAQPYAAPVEGLIGDVIDVRAWSFDVGACKPDPEIYEFVCSSLGLPAGRVLMMGDTIEADVLGPRKIGMKSIHLDRSKGQILQFSF